MSHHLNLIRGLAAWLVLAGHARGLLLAAFPDVTQPGLWDRAVYFATGLGHESVVVFFVLSGYFVGSSVWRNLSAWCWRDYLTRRLVRLYVVLLPALLLTVAVDQIGVRLPEGEAYYFHPIENFNSQPIAERMTPTAFLGNALFLQTIAVPVFGSNSALWSLANECWYYLLFPLLLLAFRPGPRWRRLSHAVVAGGLLAWLPAEMLAGFPIWILGAVVAALPSPRWCAPAVRWAAGGCVGAALLTARFAWLPRLGADYALGLAFAVWLYALTSAGSADRLPRWYGAFTGAWAGCSYSLYAVHLPLLMLLRAAVPPGVWMPGWPGYTVLGVAIAALGAAGYAFSLATEANTEAVRRRFFRGRTRVTLLAMEPIEYPQAAEPVPYTGKK